MFKWFANSKKTHKRIRANTDAINYVAHKRIRANTDAINNVDDSECSPALAASVLASLDQMVQFHDDSTNIDDESGMITTIHNINAIIILLIPLYILYYY